MYSRYRDTGHPNYIDQRCGLMEVQDMSWNTGRFISKAFNIYQILSSGISLNLTIITHYNVLPLHKVFSVLGFTSANGFCLKQIKSMHDKYFEVKMSHWDITLQTLSLFLHQVNKFISGLTQQGIKHTTNSRHGVNALPLVVMVTRSKQFLQERATDYIHSLDKVF